MWFNIYFKGGLFNRLNFLIVIYILVFFIIFEMFFEIIFIIVYIKSLFEGNVVLWKYRSCFCFLSFGVKVSNIC